MANRRWVWLLTTALSGSAIAAEPHFVEVSGGLLPYAMGPGLGGGIAAADFDDDGFVDLFVPNTRGVADQLYRNLGDGTFEEIGAAAGVASTAPGRVALWLDYDGDHRLDLLVAGDCYFDFEACTGLAPRRLFRQVATGQFEDTTLEAGLIEYPIWGPGDHRGGLSAGDLDNDGDLDLLITMWGGYAELFRNQGDGTFAEPYVLSGIGFPEDYHQPMMADFDGDGWLDIYAAVDFTANRLWINQRDGTFLDLAPASGSDNAWNDMGLTLGDVDHDGDLDIYITNIENLVEHNLLLRNDSANGVVEFERLTRTGTESGGWGWGASFLDADNDGDLDLAATNGRILLPEYEDSSKLFENVDAESVIFADVSEASGFDDTLLGSSLVAADFDRDGDLDLAQTCRGLEEQPSVLRLLENQLSGSSLGHHYLVVRPRMTGTNHYAIGAIVRLETGDQRQMRLISAGTSYLGQEPAEAFFGLGNAALVDLVTVEWPGGSRSTWTDVPADRIVDITSASLFANGFESGSLSGW